MGKNRQKKIEKKEEKACPACGRRVILKECKLLSINARKREAKIICICGHVITVGLREWIEKNPA